VQLIKDEKISEQRALKLALVASIPLSKLFNAFSSWHKLVRSVAWLSRFVKYMKFKKDFEYSKHLSVFELRNARAAVIRWVQGEAFSEDIKVLESNKE